MGLWHPVEVNEALLATPKDRLAVGVVVGVSRRVDDVGRFSLCLNDLCIPLLRDIPDSVFILLRQILSQTEPELRVEAFRDERFIRLIGLRSR